jgi:hypothetical protein
VVARPQRRLGAVAYSDALEDVGQAALIPPAITRLRTSDRSLFDRALSTVTTRRRFARSPT